MTPTELETLTRAVSAMEGCPCSHLGTSKVHEQMDGQTVWKGEVETFALQGHPSAKRAFAWSYVDDQGETQFVSLLEQPPVNSPRAAVQIAIASRRVK
jgi:hypothetical protein